MSNRNIVSKAEQEVFNRSSLENGGIETGIIMDNRSPMKNGAVKIWVDGSSSPMNNPNGWITANYALQWYGCTSSLSANNTFEENPKSYGMNFPAVDIGTRVAFFTTKSGRSFYFAHIPSINMQGMIPGIHYEKIDGNNEPVTEYNKNISEDSKAVFLPLSEGIKKQGLDKDMLRGYSSASPKREIPSRAFGILTSRGSQFVLDDGFIEGEIGDDWTNTPIPPIETPNVSNNLEKRQSEMIRLRTRSGAQILISETCGHIYMINKDGNVWVELNNTGNFDVWSLNGCTFRTNGSINMRADQDINIEAGKNINFKAVEGNITQNAGTNIMYKITGEYNISANSVGFTTPNFNISGLVTAPAMTTDKFTIGPAVAPNETIVPETSELDDAENGKLDTIITRLLYKEPCLVHDEVAEVIYTTENNNSMVVPEGSFGNTNVKSQIDIENAEKTYTEYRKNGVIYCDSISGEHAEFDEKTGKRLK